jgi:hypothetical protein
MIKITSIWYRAEKKTSMYSSHNLDQFKLSTLKLIPMLSFNHAIQSPTPWSVTFCWPTEGSSMQDGDVETYWTNMCHLIYKLYKIDLYKITKANQCSIFIEENECMVYLYSFATAHLPSIWLSWPWQPVGRTSGRSWSDLLLCRFPKLHGWRFNCMKPWYGILWYLFDIRP